MTEFSNEMNITFDQEFFLMWSLPHVGGESCVAERIPPSSPILSRLGGLTNTGFAPEFLSAGRSPFVLGCYASYFFEDMFLGHSLPEYFNILARQFVNCTKILPPL